MAVTVAAQQLVTGRSFQPLLSGARQPYARIGAALPQETSTDLLCDAGTTEMWKRWSLHCSPARQKADLLGKVVVIGAENEFDHWVVLGKRKWGFELQAFYIDALLSGHYLRASPSYLPVFLFAAFVLALEGVPALRKSSNHILWERSHVLWNLILFCTLFVLTSVIFYLMHYLPPLLMLFSALMAVVARLIFSEYENAEHGIASKNEK